MYRFLRPVFGEYTVCLHCQNVLPFLRRLTGNRVLFWSLHGNTGEWFVKTTLSSAEPLLANAQDAGIPAEIVQKKGLPFLAAKYKKRPGIFLGVLLGLALIFWGELFVWKISVNGNTVLTDEEVIEALADYGIGIGSYIPDIPVLKAQNNFLIHYSDISSIAINIKGTHIEVEMLERTHEPPIESTDGYCNVVAVEDGIVLSIDVEEGTAVVSAGDVVSAGQLLISSFTVGKRNIYRMHHARGTVTAQVYSSFSSAIPLETQVKHYTGRTKTKTVYTVLGKDFNLFLTENAPYEQFDIETTSKEIKLLGFISAPIVKTTVTYREYTRETVTISDTQAKETAISDLQAWLERQTDEVAEYDYTVTYDEIQNAYVLNASVVVIKSIGMDVPVAVGETPPEQVTPPAPQY